MLQELRIDPTQRDIIRNVNHQRLQEVGLNVSDASIAAAANVVEAMTPDERRRAAGCYFVRDHAALWLFSDRPTYFESDDETS
jgi:hypothetical protein